MHKFQHNKFSDYIVIYTHNIYVYESQIFYQYIGISKSNQRYNMRAQIARELRIRIRTYVMDKKLIGKDFNLFEGEIMC